jgi:putative glutamine amidotransferase
VKAPLIGITMYGRENGRFSLPFEYVDSVRRAGGVPLLLAPGETRSSRWFDAVDGLILAGGGDLAPDTYGGAVGASSETIYDVDAERDATELELARVLVNSSTPGMCICRGMQALNVALGGTLIEHLPEPNGIPGAEVLHRAPPREPIKHRLTIDGDTLLASLSGASEVDTFSWHHQAVRALGEDLEVVARAPDGVIEAVHHAKHPWLVAVQWHPELSSADDPTQQRLFDALVQEARAHRERRP